MNLDDAVELAVNNIIEYGCSDITFERIEVVLIKEFKKEFCDDVKAKLKRGSFGEMEYRSIQYLLTPKNRYVFDYRKAAIISPHCLAKYIALVLQYADKIEAARIPIRDNIVFSARFAPSGNDIFDKNINYSKWLDQTKVNANSEDCQYIVTCDIAAFYDRINLHRIESTLESIGVEKKLVDHTNQLLGFWSKKNSYGLPVGNVASRILAEAALIDIDLFLLAEKVIFTRYVDDYRLFAPDLLTAQKWMNKLTNRLFKDGLMLNVSKTNIKKAEKDADGDKMTLVTKEKEDNGAEIVLKLITRLTGGYNRIARKFIMPAEDKHENFKQIDISKELQTLAEQTMVEFSGIQKVVIASLVQKRFDLLPNIAEVLQKYLYGLDYFIDMLLKNHEFIPGEVSQRISTLYEDIIIRSELYFFEWYCASIAKLLSHKSYFSKKALMHIIQTTGKDVTTYASMIALEGLSENVSRSEFLTIRDWFDRSDEWERRRIVWLSRALPIDERKAWARAIKPTLKSDILCNLYNESIIREKAI